MYHLSSILSSILYVFPVSLLLFCFQFVTEIYSNIIQCLWKPEVSLSCTYLVNQLLSCLAFVWHQMVRHLGYSVTYICPTNCRNEKRHQWLLRKLLMFGTALVFQLVGRTMPPPSVWPHLFCGAGHEKRRGERLNWSLAFTLYIGSFPCAQLPGPVHTARLG